MTIPKRARRSKSLDVEILGDAKARFILTLEDRSQAPDGGELIHALEIEGTLSLPELEIVAIEPRAVHHPYPQCAASLEPVRQMVGTRIGQGFRSRVLELMGRDRGCTHFMTLMLDLGAAHTLTTFLRMRETATYASRNDPDSEWLKAGLAIEPRLENACVALRSDSPVIHQAKARNGD